MYSRFVTALILITVFTMPAMAELSADEKAVLEQYRKDKDKAERVEGVKEYVEIGEMIGKAFASTAKELGVAVNEFAETPVGKMTAGVIIWKLVGKDLIGFISGVVFFVILVSVWIYFFRRMCVIESIEYGEDGKKKKQINFYPPNHSDALIGMRVIMVLVLVGIVGTSSAMIFS